MENLANVITAAVVSLRLRQGDAEVALEVVGHLASALEQCGDDPAAAQQLLGCLVSSFGDRETKELLDAIALDVGPPLLALARLSLPCAVHATRLAHLMVESCSAREVLTLLLEVLDACGKRLEQDDEDEGPQPRSSGCLYLALNLLPLLVRVLASVQRRRLKCATDALAQLAALAAAVGRCRLAPLLRGHAAAKAPGASGAQGLAASPGSAAELAAAASGPGAIWPPGAELEHEQELAAAVNELVQPLVQCASELIDKVLQPEFRDAAVNAPDAALARTKLLLLLLHLLAALFAPCHPALSRIPPLSASLGQLLRLLASAGAEEGTPQEGDAPDQRAASGSGSKGSWRQLLDVAEGPASAEDDDEPWEFPLAPVGAALLVLEALEQSGTGAPPGLQSGTGAPPGLQSGMGACPGPLAPAAADLSRWSRPPDRRLDTLKLGCSMSKLLMQAAGQQDSPVLLLKGFQLLAWIGQLATQQQQQQQKQQQQQQQQQGSGDERDVPRGDALLEPPAARAQEEEEEVSSIVNEVLEVLAVNIAHGSSEGTRGAAFSSLKALLAGLPPPLRFLGLQALSGMPSPNIVALSMQLLQQQVTRALMRPGTPQAQLFAAPAALAPVRSVLHSVLGVVQASAGSEAGRLECLEVHADAASAAVNVVRCLLLRCQAPGHQGCDGSGLSTALATAVSAVQSEVIQPLARLVSQLQRSHGQPIEQAEYLAVGRLSQVLQHMDELTFCS